MQRDMASVVLDHISRFVVLVGVESQVVVEGVSFESLTPQTPILQFVMKSSRVSPKKSFHVSG